MTAQQLKNSILQMAVQGKLVPQDPNDEPASVLLERIRKEKEALVKAGKIKKDKNPSVIFRGADNTPYEKVGNSVPVSIANEIHFEIPNSWEWVRLGYIINLKSGQDFEPSGYNSKGLGIPYITGASNIEDGNVIINRWTETPNNYAMKDDLLIVCKGAGVGKMAVLKNELVHIARQIMAITPIHVDLGYLQIVISSNLEALRRKMQGVIPGISRLDVLGLLFPLPPFKEQLRIASKVQELEPIIKAYDDAYLKSEDLNKRFPELLKKSILQQAIQGKLVPQDPNDEPADVLLSRIRAEKQRLIREGKIKKDKHVSIIFRRDNSHYEKQGDVVHCIDDEIPFEIPYSWKWSRLMSLVEKEIKRGKSPQYDDKGKVLVFAQKCNTKTGCIDMTLAKHLSDSAFQRYSFSEYMLDKDIVVNSTGHGTLGRIGLFRDTDRLGPNEIVPDSHVTVIRPSVFLVPEFVLHVLKYYQPFLEEQGSGSTNQTELKPEIISQLLIPVPPFAEQNRIIEIIKHLSSEMIPL